jgi:uncharacterized membrane protein YqhA
MFQHLLKVRYIAVVISLISLLHAVAFLTMGIEIAVRAYWHVLGDVASGWSRPGVELLHSLDFLFVSLVLLVMGLGIVKLFVLNPAEKDPPTLPVWLRIESISQLKVLLWETILTTLVIVALSDLIRGLFTKLDWTALIMPIAIMVLALSLFFMKKA